MTISSASDPAFDGPVAGSVTALFEEQVRARADAVALLWRDQIWSYAELNGRSDRLARSLMARGVRPGDRVALLVERAPAAICAVLAVLKAGAAYVPLDLDYPAAHLAFMIEDCAPAALIVGAGVAVPDGLSWACPTLRLTADGAASDGLLAADPPPGGGGADVAYVMYTSGSTGRPKGVMVPHRGIARLVCGPDYARFGTDEVVLQVAPLGFDASTFEIWAPLLNGGHLVFLDPGRASLREIGAAVRGYGVTSLLLTTGLFHLMVDEALDDLAGLRQLLAGGDVLSPSHVRKVVAALPRCRLINVYGPTENTVFTTCYTVPRDQASEAIPIGHPIRGTRVHILDEALNPVPDGEPGQLCTSGIGLALGYLNRPELTAERFRPDPFSADPDARLYLTGDLARRRPDGALDFLGRVDTQIKIDGKRVELGEIESVLRACPGVRDAAVAVERTGTDGKRLHAFLVALGGSTIDREAVRTAVAARLPAHMCPSTLAVLDALPLVTNGKVDRAKLADLVTTRAADAPGGAGTLPRTETERRIAAVWRTVLAADAVGIDDNFFDLGGSSLKLMAVHQRLTNQDDARAVSVVDLFARPTIRALAAFLDGATGRAGARPGIGGRAALQAEALRRLATAGRSSAR